MVQIKDKTTCCGCEACVQICPVNCIDTSFDDHGFIYPTVNFERCIGCGLCDSVCPYLNQESEIVPLKQFAAFSNDYSIRERSSSGGIFSLLAERVIKRKGVVFGAGFDGSFVVHHMHCDSLDGLDNLRGSKYVQSRIGDSFNMVKHYLLESRQVLFSGTPCQVSALKLFLKKDYDNLLTVEVFCHGVPSPKVWNDYLASQLSGHSCVSFSFRDKSKHGWRQYSYRLDKSNGEVVCDYYFNNSYSDGFLNNLTLRPSCFNCPSKLYNSRADISIGDYWGVEQFHPEIDDNMGCSAVVIHNSKGASCFEAISCVKKDTDLESILRRNSLVWRSAQKPYDYDSFWRLYLRKGINSINISLDRRCSNIYILLQRINKLIDGLFRI